MTCEPRRVWNPCPSCDGEGGWEETTGFVDRDTGCPWTRKVACDECGGTGSVEQDAVLIDETDLDDLEEAA